MADSNNYNSMRDLRKNSWGIILVGLIAAILIIAFIEKDKRDLLSFVTVFGTIASLVALILAHLQIASLKESSSEISNAIAKTVYRVDNIVSVSDISRTKTLVEDIQNYLRVSNYYGALIRMGDLKESLISAKYTKGLEQIHKDKEYNKVVMDMGINIDSINDYLVKKEKEPDVSIILKNLEMTKQLLVECNNKIKKLAYGIN